jgi:drug/metabolite transporter (DMT)-like permease
VRLRFSLLDAALIVTMAFWAGNIVVSKSATDVLPPFAWNAIRFTLSVIGLFTLLRLQRIDLHLPRSEFGPIFVAGLLNYVLYQAAFIIGLHLTTAGNTALIVSIGPVWVVLINAARGQERLTRGALIGVFVALIGVLIVVAGRYAVQGQVSFGRATLAGDALNFGASFFWALGILSARQPLSRNPPLPTTFWMLACGALLQIIIGVPQLIGVDWSTALTPSLVAALLYSGLLSIAIGTIIFNSAIKRIGAARTAIYSYLQPLMAAGMAIVLLGEPFTLWLVVGGALTFTGLLLVRRA